MKAVIGAVLVAAASFCHPLVSFSQTSGTEIGNHPLDGFGDYLRTDELVLFWTEDIFNEEADRLERKVFSQIIYNDNQPDVDDLIFQRHDPELVRHEYNTDGVEPHFRGADFHHNPVDVVTGDFNGDGYETFIGAYAGDGVIHVVLNELNPQRMSGDNVDNFDIPITNYEIRTVAESYVGGLFRLVSADLTRDGKDDLILAYRTDTDYVIEVFSVTGDLNLERIGSYNAGAWPEGYSTFDVAAGKMTPDNRREIVFAYAASTSSATTVVVEADILSVDPGHTPLAISSLGARELYSGSVLARFAGIAVETGDFTGNLIQEAAVGFNIWKSADSGGSGQDNLFVRILDLADGDPAVWPDFDYEATIVEGLTALTIDTGDVDGDGQDEIVVMNDGLALVLRAPERPPIMEVDLNEDDDGTDAPEKNLSIYVDQNLNLSLPLAAARYSSAFMVISDVNQRRDLIRLGQSGFSSEVIVVNDSGIDNLAQGELFNFRVSVLGLESTASTRLRHLTSDNFQAGTRDQDQRGRSYALAAGDFTLSRIRYENPRRYQLTDIRQPWVILKAPPTHFDMFGESILDINRCFGNECGFSATFTSTETEGNSISTSVQGDWTVSGSSSVQHSIISFGMDHKLGKGFGHAEFASTKESFTQTITATDTDRIYAAVSSFDLWEYDVYDGGEFVGTVLTVIPTGSSNTWLSSDSYFAYDYRSETEETNLLSYPREITARQSDNIGTLLKGLEESDPSFVIGTGTARWSLEFEDFQAGESTDQSTVPIGGSLGLEAFGLDLPGLYNTTDMTTNRVQVSNSIKIDVEMGTLNPQFPTASYTVYPYAYWHADGPLVIDYAVRLDKQLLGGPQSLWDNRYGQQPDPALKLPWRHIKEKAELNAGGGPVEFDEDIIELSKSIRFYPIRPRPDDTVTVEIDVHNFSLVDLDQLVDVHAYLGHPDKGGERITLLNDEDQLSTQLILPLRGKETVTGRFIMPDMISERRLYAVINPDNAVDEIHVNNNRGYVPMSTEGVTVSIDDDGRYAALPERVKLHQNYPNPFSPSTNIRYTLSTAGDVRLDVFNLLGQHVSSLVDGHRTAGEHTVAFDASGLGSGVYFYRIETGCAVQTMKMMLVK